MLRTLRNKKGVTLIELLAVVIILGIIAAIAVPTIGGLIDNQRENAAEAEWTNIQEAARLYATTEGLESGDSFSLATLVEEDYIDWEGSIEDITNDPSSTATTAGYTSGDLYYAQIFDDNGDVVDVSTTVDVDEAYAGSGVTIEFSGNVHIDGYLVNGEEA